MERGIGVVLSRYSALIEDRRDIGTFATRECSWELQGKKDMANKASDVDS